VSFLYDELVSWYMRVLNCMSAHPRHPLLVSHYIMTLTITMIEREVVKQYSLII